MVILNVFLISVSSGFLKKETVSESFKKIIYLPPSFYCKNVITIENLFS